MQNGLVGFSLAWETYLESLGNLGYNLELYNALQRIKQW